MNLHYLLMADHTMLQKQLYSSIKSSGLSIGQPKVLDYLKENNGAYQKDIAHGCYIEPASLSTILNGMEKKGLIKRTADIGSRRNVKIYMTDKGHEMCGLVADNFKVLENKALTDFSEEERKQLNDLLIKLHNNLSN